MSALWRLLWLARARRIWLLASALLMLVTALANVALLSISGWFLATMAAAGISGAVVNYFTPAAIIRALAIVRSAGRYGERLLGHQATLYVLGDLRCWLYQRLEPLAPAVFHRYHSADLWQRLQRDIERLDHFYLRLLLPVAAALPAVAAVVVFAFYQVASLGWLLLGALLSSALVLPWLSWRRARRPGAEQVAGAAQLQRLMLDGLQGMEELQINGVAEAQHRQMARAAARQDRVALRLAAVAADNRAATEALAGGTALLAAALLLPGVAAGLHSPASLAMWVLLAMASFELVQALPVAIEQLPPTLAAARRVFALADGLPARAEPLQPRSPVATGGGIDCRDLRFAWPGGVERFGGLSFAVGARESVLLRAPSGWGKSTLAALLAGFASPDGGAVRIAGVPIEQIPGPQLRRHIAVLGQRAPLRAASLRDNLLLAAPGAEEAALRRACEAAGLADLIAQWPDGLDTWLGETGNQLSGGQARRVALAQLFLREAPIAVLDEPTESLDPATEALLIDSLARYARGRCVLVFSHRPALGALADRVIELA